MSVGERLLDLRKKKQLTQVQLAKELNVSNKIISKWEKDVISPSSDKLEEIAKFFNVSIDYILTGQEKIKKEKQPKDTTKKSHKILKTILLILFIGVIVTISIIFKGDYNTKYLFSKNSKTKAVEKVYELDYKKIKIDSKLGNVKVKINKENKIKLVVYSDNLETVKVTDEKKVLNVKVDTEPCSGICFNVKIPKVELYLPNGYDKVLDIKVKLGDVTVDKFQNAKIKIKESCGNIKLDGGSIVDITNNLGNIDIKDVNIIKVQDDCGNINIEKATNVKAINKLGNITIKKVEESLDLLNKCGDIDVKEINLIRNSKIESNLGNINIGKTNDIYINAKTDLGNVKIKQNNKDSEIKLDIQNDCGDITVKN